MVKRFSIYILWEVLKMFVVALVAFTTLALLVLVVKELLDRGLSLLAIYQLLPFALPMALQFALPTTMLFAVCTVYGRISADNEVMAIKAAGIPPIKIITPTLILGFLISPLAVWMNDLAVSWGKQGFERVVMHHIEEIAYRYLSTQGWYSYSNSFSIHVDGIGPDGRELLSPVITFHGTSPGSTVTISARSGSLKLEPATEELKIRLVDYTIEKGNSSSGLTRQAEDEFAIPLGQIMGNTTGPVRPQQIALRHIGTATIEQNETLRRTEELLAARTAMALTSGRYDWLDDQPTRQAISELITGRERLYVLHTEPWRRWASGFSCFFFVWVGIPLAIWMRSADYWTSFGMCFLPTLLTFYPFMALGADRAKDGSWPPYSVWLGNLVLLAIGAFWLRRVYRS